MFSVSHSMCFHKKNSPNGSYVEQAVPRISKPALTLGLPSERASSVIDGSLPTSPESDCEDLVEQQLCPPPFPERAALERDTRECVVGFFLAFSGLPRACKCNSKVIQTMHRVVDSLLVKHELVYKGIIGKLSLDDVGDDMSVITKVAKEMFSDGITNWGRIASLLAFGAVVSKHQKERGQDHCVSLVAEEISSYLLSAQMDWLLKNKAWDGFVEFFHVRDPESTVRNTLMAFVTLAGIGAGLAFFTR